MRLLGEALTLYYVQELTQAEVARRLGISTAKVNRLLQQAREQGMVEVKIHVPFQHLFDMEARLRAIFDLTDVIILPRLPDDTRAMAHTLGRAGAIYLVDRLQGGEVIAMGGGTAVYGVVQALEADHAYDVKVVPTSGGVQGRVTTDVNYLATELASRLGGIAYQLHAPAFTDTHANRQMFMSIGPIREILDIARGADVALMGVGTVDYETSRYVQFTALSPGEMQEIAEEGGVGEIGAYVYDRAGIPCAEAYTRRVVGLDLKELRKIPFIIGVAATAIKALPLYGALRGGYLDALITDEAAAEGILALFEEEFRMSP
jgi:DNA-binding transcriptional regulator LsrR (DeoR family)